MIRPSACRLSCDVSFIFIFSCLSTFIINFNCSPDNEISSMKKKNEKKKRKLKDLLKCNGQRINQICFNVIKKIRIEKCSLTQPRSFHTTWVSAIKLNRPHLTIQMSCLQSDSRYSLYFEKSFSSLKLFQDLYSNFDGHFFCRE